MKTGDRFTTDTANGIVCSVMNGLRDLRRATGLGQRGFAALLAVPLETFRTWVSGRRAVVGREPRVNALRRDCVETRRSRLTRIHPGRDDSDRGARAGLRVGRSGDVT